jgi:hypothetical protein
MGRKNHNGASLNGTSQSSDGEPSIAITSANADPLNLDDSPESIGEPAVGETVAKDDDGVPYCPLHHCRMVQSSGGNTDNPKCYYKCKVDGCKQTARIIKTTKTQIVPDQPQACPRCSRDRAPVICERDPKSSTVAMVILKCPSCGWKSSAMVVPQLAAAYFARQGRSSLPPVEEIGAR